MDRPNHRIYPRHNRPFPTSRPQIIRIWYLLQIETQGGRHKDEQEPKASHFYCFGFSTKCPSPHHPVPRLTLEESGGGLGNPTDDSRRALALVRIPSPLFQFYMLVGLIGGYQCPGLRLECHWRWCDHNSGPKCYASGCSEKRAAGNGLQGGQVVDHQRWLVHNS